MSTLSSFASLLTHSLAWALVHSLWQSIAIYTFLFIILKALPGMNARIKYYLSFGSLMLLAVWFTDTWISQYQQMKGSVVYVSASGTDITQTTTYVVKTAGDLRMHNAIFNSMIHGIENNSTIILCMYMAGLCFMLLRFMINIIEVKKLRASGLMPIAPVYETLLANCRNIIGVTRPVQLYLSNRINVPMMIGTLKPIILLPLTTINHLTTEQVEAILLHELAHIKRYDYLLNMIQTTIETVLFFNPCVWAISAIARKEREHCCDDMVVNSSTDPLPYAKALAILEDKRMNTTTLAMAASGHKNHLFNRIKRIMEMKNSKTNNSQLTIIIVAIIAITFSTAMFTFSPSFAQKAKTAKSDTVKKSVYRYKTVTIDSNGHKTVTEKVSTTPIHDKVNNDGAEEMAPMPPEPPMAPEPPAAPGSSKKTISTTITVDDAGHKKVISKQTTSNNIDDQIEAAMTEVGTSMEQVSAEVSKAMAEAKRATAEATAAVNAVDWNKISEAMTNSIKVLQNNLANKHLVDQVGDKVAKQWEESIKTLKQSRKEIEARTKKQTKTMTVSLTTAGVTSHTDSDCEALVEKMRKDGLISKTGAYAIRKENDELYINGTKQSEATYNKYLSYLNNKKVLISGSDGRLTITIND
ncbi:MAG: hypothetical protein JWQ38_1434 [Flavipsychrobacter sp.]|nr:hypothetical protein [Flavipsychrobacter sp.]